MWFPTVNPGISTSATPLLIVLLYDFPFTDIVTIPEALFGIVTVTLAFFQIIILSLASTSYLYTLNVFDALAKLYSSPVYFTKISYLPSAKLVKVIVAVLLSPLGAITNGTFLPLTVIFKSVDLTAA